MHVLTIEEKQSTFAGKTTPQLLMCLSQIEGRRSWIAGGKGLKVETTPHNIDLLGGLENVTVIDRRAVAAFDLLPAGKVARAPYLFQTDPYPHQTKALDYFHDKDIMGLFFEQGTGKTKTDLDWSSMLYRSGLITGKVVVSKNGAHAQWIDSEIPHHLSCDAAVACWPCRQLPVKGKGLQIISFNWESIRTSAAFDMLEEFCKLHKGRLLITADESHKMKNEDSQAAKAMHAIRGYSSHRDILTGTPISTSLEDEKAQIDWLDPKIIGMKYKTTFRNKYCIMGGFQGKKVTGIKNIASFRDKVDPYTMRVTKEEIGILPKQYNEYVFNLTKEQKELLRQMKDDLKVELADKTTIEMASASAIFTKVQQISNGFIFDEDGVAHRIMPIDKNPRVIALLQWLDNIDGKAIVWHRFREDGKIIREALEGAGISMVQYDGSTSASDRKDAVTSFLDPKGARVFDGNPTSAGTGLNLQGTSNFAGYYSNCLSPIDRWQSEDRNHRIGVKGTVTYTDFIARGSADRRMMQLLRHNKAISEMGIGDFLNFVFGDDD